MVRSLGWRMSWGIVTVLEPAEAPGELTLVEVAAPQGGVLLGRVVLDELGHPRRVLVGEEGLIARIGAQVGRDLGLGGIGGERRPLRRRLGGRYGRVEVGGGGT